MACRFESCHPHHYAEEVFEKKTFFILSAIECEKTIEYNMDKKD